jgi:hypothetical protein
MRVPVRAVVCGMVLLSHASGIPCGAKEFQVRSADGTEIRGEFTDTQGPQVAVIFVPGTGLFDRDAQFGESGTPRDFIFKDRARRVVARGAAAVRYDPRGVRHGAEPANYLDRAVLATRTTGAMADDLAAVYHWTLSPSGLGARCTVFFVHSEGMYHVARLAESGTPAPALVIGMGGPMQSPVDTLKWQLTERDASSLEMMDADHDGMTTNDEVRANWTRTPTAANGVLEPLLHPQGAWHVKDLADVRAIQSANYAKLKADALSHGDAEPFPDAETLSASYQWWKSWFLDERSAAERLAGWGTPVSLHFGDKDSQLPAAPQIAAASTILGAARFKAQVYPDRGHSLGTDVLFGPIDEAIADKIADEAAAAGASCVK